MDVTILDGATGTELSRRGVDTSGPLWAVRALAEAPEAVRDVHREYVRAGCDVLTTCTFRTHERNLERAGWGGRGDELNRMAVQLAREAARSEGRDGVRVAGGIAPLEDCWRPEAAPEADVLRREHARQAESLARAGADLLIVETMGSSVEAVTAVHAGVAAGLPTWCSFAVTGEGKLLTGEPVGDAARRAVDAGAEAVLVNCLPLLHAGAVVRAMREVVTVPVGAYPSIAHGPEGFDPQLMVEPEEFADVMRSVAYSGAAILGGCCGTEPRHLAALAREVAD